MRGCAVYQMFCTITEWLISTGEALTFLFQMFVVQSSVSVQQQVTILATLR